MLLVAGALGAAPGGAGRDAGQARADPSGPSTLWTASLAIGHDSDLLADPDGRGVLEPVGTSFRTAATRLRATWFGSGPREERLTLTGQAALGDHGAGLPGLDSDLGLVGGYSRWLRDAALLDVGLELDRFRRETLPLFDLDRLRAELGLTYVTGTRWWMGPVVSTTWTGYPGRALEDGDTQRDRRLDLGVRLNRTDRGVSQLALEALHRRNRSSDRLVEYDGWLGLAELRLTPAERLTVRGTLAVDRRAYRDYPVLAADGTTVLGQRRDRTWRAALALELATGSWVTPFAGGIYVHQTSTIDAFAFDELRLEVGIELRLLPRRSLTSGPAARPAAGRRPAAGETLTALLDAALARAGATAGDAAPTDIRRPLATVL
ncbi:MAG: hypothetical protein PVF43_09335, partial [Candidatus Eiseniibacteriota bacterium]